MTDDATPEATPKPSSRTSGWALASVICSIAVCPVLTLAGPVLGVKALRDIKATGRPGRGMALTGIVLGVLMTLGWGTAAWWWSRHARAPLIHGPVAELRAGLAGDLEGFRAGFVGDGSSASDDEARRFLDTLTSRYGTLGEIRQRRDPAAEARWSAGRVRVPYMIDFDRQSVPMEATFVVQEEGKAGFVLAWAWIAVLDPEREDLVYPASAAAAVEALEVDPTP